MFFDFPEGATPLHDYSDLLLPWVQNLNDLNRVEAEGISYAQRKYLRASSRDIASWFQSKELKAIHYSMFGNVWAWAGKFRKSITSIGVDPSLISFKIAEFCEEVASWFIEPIELTFLEKSARIHHRLVQIHPFENGNGRFSRLVADRCLLCWKCPHPVWPNDLNLEGTARKIYIKALKEADKGDYRPLLILMQNLGAEDPDISTLFQENYYKSFFEDAKGRAKIRALLRNGKNPNGMAKNGLSSLHILIRARIERSRKIDLLKLLIEHGADINKVDKNGLTPFQAAIAVGDQESAFLLRSKRVSTKSFGG